MTLNVGANSSSSPSDVLRDNHPRPHALGGSTERSNTLASPHTPEPLSVTLGLELEFILAVNTYPEKASHQNYDETWGQGLVQYALSQPMVVNCAVCGIEHAFQLDTDPESDSKHEHWTVEEDSSLILLNDERESLERNEEYFHFYDIEVTSRILCPEKNHQTAAGKQGSGHVHEITYVQEIDAVLNRLHEFFAGPQAGHKVNRTHLVLNGTSGLHVHVGNERRGFPLPTVKKVLSTYVANERVVDSLHAASRIGGSRIATEPLEKAYYERMPSELHLLPSPYNASWATMFVEIAHTLKRHRLGYSTVTSCLPRPSDQPASSYPETHLNNPWVGKAVDSFYVGDWLEIIDHAPTLKAIQQLQTGLGRGTVNLRNLSPYDSDEKDDTNQFEVPQMMTIEFRQHAGSLDSAEIHAWMDFLVSIVQHAHYTSNADYQALTRTEWLQPDYGSSDLLTSIGCSLDTKRFYGQKLAGEFPIAHKSVFAANIAENDLSRAEAMIAPLLEFVEGKRRQDHHPDSVKDRIREKFRMGGYGKFSNEYLDQLGDFNLNDPQLGLRDKLIIDRESYCEAKST